MIKVYEAMKEDIKNPSVFLITADQLEPVNKNLPNLYRYKEPTNYLHNYGALFSGCTKVEFSNGNRVDVIITDSLFDLLPEFVQEFLLKHEEGHHIHGDLDAMLNNKRKAIVLLLLRCLGKTSKMELAADAYAADYVGYKMAIKSIEWIKNNTDIPFLSKIELNSRIRALKKK